MSLALIKRANEQLTDMDYHCLFLPYSRSRLSMTDDKILLSYAKRDDLKHGLIQLSQILKF